MNLLKKQGLLNSITLYLGTALGFFNLIILFQRYLTIEEIGYFSLLTAISVTYIQLSSLGFPNVITRYFPHFKTEDKRHHGFPLFVGLICLAGFTVVTLFFLGFKEAILDMQAGKEATSLMGRYYPYIIPVSFFSMAFILQETFARAIFKSVLPAFLREVALRVFTSLGVLFVMVGWLDFEGFLNVYLFANIFILVVLSLYTYSVKTYKAAGIAPEVRRRSREMINFGLFSMLGGSSFALIQSLDIIVLKFMTGEALVGYYSTFFLIASVISLPAKALNTTSYQLVADAWKNTDLQKIGSIYHKTSLVQFLIGSLMLVGLIINRDNILYLLVKPDKPHYDIYFNIFIIVGIAFLIDITGGLNSAIISFSSYYKTVMRFLVSASVICCVLNVLLIPVFGLAGAAWSYLVTMLLLNFGYWLFIKVRFGLQPFNQKYVYVVAISLIVLVVGVLIPRIDNFFADVFVRSSIATVVYSLLAYYLKISEDINDLIDKVLKGR